jgi:hypothetical protein
LYTFEICNPEPVDETAEVKETVEDTKWEYRGQLCLET